MKVTKEEAYGLLLEHFIEGNYKILDINGLANTMDELLLTIGASGGKSDRNAKIVELRYGLKDGETKTLKQVGEIYSLTKERIREIQAKTIRMLRHPSRRHRLERFIGRSKYG